MAVTITKDYVFTVVEIENHQRFSSKNRQRKSQTLTYDYINVIDVHKITDGTETVIDVHFQPLLIAYYVVVLIPEPERSTVS